MTASNVTWLKPIKNQINTGMKAIYLHGAGASSNSFSYLIEKLPQHDYDFINYDISTPIANIIASTDQFISNQDEPVVLVGHSLGGIIATALCHNPKVSKLVTLCAPFGGLKYAETISLFNSHSLFRDLSEHGHFLRSIRNTKIPVPFLSIVGTKGLPSFMEPNDGALSVSSQIAMRQNYIALQLNHFEVLLSNSTVDLIRDFYAEIDDVDRIAG